MRVNAVKLISIQKISCTGFNIERESQLKTSTGGVGISNGEASTHHIQQNTNTSHKGEK